jgi:hypothetical protein
MLSRSVAPNRFGTCRRDRMWSLNTSSPVWLSLLWSCAGRGLLDEMKSRAQTPNGISSKESPGVRWAEPSREPGLITIQRHRTTGWLRPPAYALQPLRQARRYNDTELDRAGGQITGRRPAMTGSRPSPQQRQALEPLASSRQDANEELLIHGHGLSRRMLARLDRRGLAATEREVVKAGGKAIEVVRATITKVGRQSIEGRGRDGRDNDVWVNHRYFLSTPDQNEKCRNKRATRRRKRSGSVKS